MRHKELDFELHVNRDSTIKKRVNNLKGASEYQKSTMIKLILLLKHERERLDTCKIRGRVFTSNSMGMVNMNFSFYSEEVCIFTGTIKSNETFYLKVNDSLDAFRDLDVFEAYITNQAGERKLAEGSG